MNEPAVIEKSKDFLKQMAYNIRYGRKFKKLNIDKSFADVLIGRSGNTYEKQIFNIISKSKNQNDFEKKVKDYLKSADRNTYASVLLLGNITGKYVFNDFYYDSIKNLNIDAFSKENQDLLPELKLHFNEYIINNNKSKNTFIERIKVGNTSIKDLSKDIDEENLVKDFEKVLEGERTDDIYSKPKVIVDYLMKTIGIYSREDIKNNFDFILYDMSSNNSDNLDSRREKYLLHNSLSNNQLKKIEDLSVLKKRLQDMNGKEAEQLVLRLNKIENNLDKHITELEDIYSDYEILYRQDLIDNLYVPKKDVTIIDNYKDLKPQMIHRFIRSTEKLRDMEMKKIKEKIISERTDKNDSEELTVNEQERLNKMINKMEVDLNQYKVNYSTDGKGTIYYDAMGLEAYRSNTSNQISASVYEGIEFINSPTVGIIGIGFNKDTLSVEAIAMSSNSYKTTNKGLNNIEYDEKNEFKEMSAPFSELIKSRGQSEIVMNRRGMDFDTKASYIFVAIDSSNSEQTKDIMDRVEQIREKEGLKAVVYDINKIRESLERSRQEQYEER